MKCPFCAHVDDKVIDSREGRSGDTIRRRRECLKCGRRFTTYERIDEIPAGKAARTVLRFSATTRGEHGIGRLHLSSVYRKLEISSRTRLAKVLSASRAGPA